MCCKVGEKQDQVNNADSAIIFLINHWSVRIVKVVWSVRVVEVVQDVQIIHVVHWSKWSKWSRWYGQKVESSAVFCLSRIRNIKVRNKSWLINHINRKWQMLDWLAQAQFTLKDFRNEDWYLRTTIFRERYHTWLNGRLAGDHPSENGEESVLEKGSNNQDGNLRWIF